MAQVHIQSETDIPQGWRYVVEVTGEDGRTSVHRVRLAWVDHNHWAGDRTVPPSRVAQALLESLLAAAPDRPLPERFDAATVRRWLPNADAEVRSRL